MNTVSPDQIVLDDQWSDLSRYREPPVIDFERMHAYRDARMRMEIKKAGAAMCMLVNPISMRYAANYRNYALFQAHIPTTYMFVPVEGKIVLYNGYEPDPGTLDMRQGQPLSFFEGGHLLADYAARLAREIAAYLVEMGTDCRRVALEYVNPSLTRALLDLGIESIDGSPIAEEARTIKSDDEIACMRWAIAVAEHGINKVKQVLKPGVSELQLWGLLNYANIANNGDWHDGRMLASGPRINPWLREASERKVESGDLVGFDTDMIGPNGYFADISRTIHCGPDRPTRRQKEIYRLAMAEIEHNMQLVRPGLSFFEIQEKAFPVPEEFRQNAYPCIMHAVGLCDEFPQIKPGFRGANAYDGQFEPGMVICVESYMGAAGETDGVKLEQQVLVTDKGCELLTTYPFEDSLM